MKILIEDGMQIKVGTGIGKYSQYLYNELKKALPDTDEVELLSFSPEKNGWKIFHRIKYLLYINSKKFRDKCKDADIVHFTNFVIPIFRQKGVKYAVTIHDLTAFAYPETLPPVFGIYSRMNIRYAMKHADVVFTVSESIKKELIQKFAEYKEKINVAYPGLYEYNKPDDCESGNNVLEKYGLTKKNYFIFVGTIEKRKNIGFLIDAFAKFKQTCQNRYKLVLAGRPGKGYDEYSSIIKRHTAISDEIICTGYVSSETCNELYKNAAAYVFPSLYEGFGSTQLECMVNHLPLICSNIPTNREISNNYGLFFDLGDTDGLVEQMKKIAGSEYDYAGKAAIADSIVEKFRWRDVVEKFICAYQKATNENTEQNVLYGNDKNGG